MNRYLQPGYNFSLNGIEGVFEIKSIIGYGSSCAVYFAEFTDKNGICTEHLLKEYNPNKLELYRNESGALFADNEDDLEAFKSGLLRFESGYKKQLGIRKLHETKNTTSNIQGIYEGNGTKYIDMTCFNGTTYDKIRETSLYDLLRRIKTIIQTIKHYHDNGFLHLDLKPNNIFTIPESVELVMFFDFDSLLTKDEIMSGGSVSYTEAWAAPEILLPGRKSKICEATDLFSIGEMMFYQLFGRHSFADERRSFAKYEYDFDSEICKNVDPKIFPMLSEFFGKTICGVVSKRYVTANEMLEVLDQMIPLANPHEPRIVSSLPSLQSFFVGRDSEIEEIHNKLAENGLLFISGMGGIGKSELVKNYAAQYKDSYDAIIFAPYITDIMMLITDDKSVSVANIEMFQGEQPNEYYDRKLRKLNELCNERTLFIIDNFDTAEDPHLNDILSLGCKKLITTRNTFADYNYPQIEIGSLAMRSDINSIFNKYYKKALDDESRKTVDLIIDLVDGHTMTVELLAKQMRSGRVTPQKMLDALNNGGLVDSGKEKVEAGKDSVLSKQSAYDHIRALFDISDLDENEIYILGNLSLIPHSGISTEQFKDWCELEDYETINSLVSEGWIRWDEEKDFISLHPVVSDIMFELVKERKTDIASFLDNLSAFFNNESFFDTMESDKRYNFTKLKIGICEKIIKSELNTYAIAKFLRTFPLGLEYGNHTLLIKYQFKSIEIGKKISDYPPEYIADAYRYIGFIYIYIDEIDKAEKFIKQAHKIISATYKENIEKETPHLAAAIYNDLGVIHYKKQNFEEAEKEFECALSFLENTNSEQKLHRSKTLLNLGNIYLHTYQHEKAKECFDKALEILIREFGENNVNVMSTYFSLGEYYRLQNDYNNAKTNYENVLKISRLSQVKNIDIAKAQMNIALMDYDLKNYDNAEERLIEALDIFISMCCKNPLSVAGCYFNLGMVYDKKAKQKNKESYTLQAEDCYLKSISIRESVNDQSPKLSYCYDWLGKFYLNRGLTKKALEIYLKTFKIQTEIFGEDNYRTKNTQKIIDKINNQS